MHCIILRIFSTRIMLITMILSLNLYAIEREGVPMEVKKERFHLADIWSQYENYEWAYRRPDGSEFLVYIRFQDTRVIIDVGPLGTWLEIGRTGQTMYRCDSGCKGMPVLYLPRTYRLRSLNQWQGTWYAHIYRYPFRYFAKAEKKRWVIIPREEFPLEIAFENEYTNFSTTGEYAQSAVRDSTRKNFSNSKSWKYNKDLWYFLLTGNEVSYENLDYVFPDTEAFSFFLKYIKPHWKFDNPVLDMDFSPYEGMDPGQIPFPEEIGNIVLE
jgi:hypothetical protein